MKKKKLALLTGIVAIAGAVIHVYKKVKKKAAPKSEENNDESSDKVDDEEDFSIFEDEI